MIAQGALTIAALRLRVPKMLWAGRRLP